MASTYADIVSLNGSAVPACMSSAIADYPNAVTSAAAGIITHPGDGNKRVIICGGGTTTNANPTDKCYTLNPSTASWELAGLTLPEPMMDSGRSYDENWGLVMAGGLFVFLFPYLIASPLSS